MHHKLLLKLSRASRAVNKSLFGSRYAKKFKAKKDYFRHQSIAGYIGWTGHGNLGDDLLYDAFRKLFECVQILLYSDFPHYNVNAQFQPIEIQLYRQIIKRQNFYDFILLGGGTLINIPEYLKTLKDIQKHNKTFFVFGTGVRDPVFWNNHSKTTYRNFQEWRNLLRDSALVKVRGPQSADILSSWGIPKPDVIGDPALSICTPKISIQPKQRLVGINLGSHGKIWGQQQEVNEIVAKLVQYFLDEKWEVEFIPMHTIDLKMGLDFIRTFKFEQVSIWKNFSNRCQTVERIKSYDLLVGQRLHSMVIACGCGVPAIALEYRPKCSDFMESMGLESFSFRTDRLKLDDLVDSFERIKHHYMPINRNLVDKSNHYRKLQKEAAAEAMKLAKLS